MKIPKVKVVPLYTRNGEVCKNQYNIVINGWRLFQSYSTIIVAISPKGQIYLDKEKWDYSYTTGYYRNQFLNIDKKETEKLIKNKQIKLVNLNGE